MIQVSGAQLHNTPSAHCVVCSPPIKSPPITTYPSYTLLCLRPPSPSSNHHTVVHAHKFFLCFLNLSTPWPPTAVSLLSMSLSLWPNKSTPGSLSKETWNTNSTEYMYPCVHCSVSYNRQYVEAAQVPICRWVDETTVGQSHNGILLVHTKEGNSTLHDSMDGPGEHCAKWNISQTEKDKYRRVSLACGI